MMSSHYAPEPDAEAPTEEPGMAQYLVDADLLFITLDTLRYDVAQACWQSGKLPVLSRYLGEHGWQCRHTPASFTYAAHHAFFAGFLPTPLSPGPHMRLFASAFAGSESTGDKTFQFDEPTLPQALAAKGFHTICIGGTGFFNPQSALGTVLPELFVESHWSRSVGVTDPQSEKNQIALAIERLTAVVQQPVFLFINISAIHQPNWFYLEDSHQCSGDQPIDSLASHASALQAVDSSFSKLFEYLQEKRRSTFCIICSDHGTAYGENGYTGHRVAHETVWNVPYTQFFINGQST